MTEHQIDEHAAHGGDMERARDGSVEGTALAVEETRPEGEETDFEQDTEAIAFAAAFLQKVVRIRGVRIERSAFLQQELRKLGLDRATVDRAVATTPVQAGVTVAQLDELAGASIAFETNKASALSFAAGLPGGLAMFAAVPADITQYYVHAFRVMQKLAYFYGWQNFIADPEDVDDETLGKLAVFLGVMMGVKGASASLTSFAAQVARPAIQKQISQRMLTRTVWFGPVRSTLKLIGIELTKDSFAKTVTKAVPVVGGVISGGMTMVSLRTQSGRLRTHLRELPPPGVDAADCRRALEEADAAAADAAGRVAAARESIEDAAGRTASGMKGAARRARGSASAAGGGALRRGQSLLSTARTGEREVVESGDGETVEDPAREPAFEDEPSADLQPPAAAVDR